MASAGARRCAPVCGGWTIGSDSAPLPRISIAGVAFDAVTEAACVEATMRAIAAGQGGWTLTFNLDHLALLRRDPRHALLYAAATLVVADGIPLVWAASISGTPLPGRIAGSDLIWSLSSAAAHNGFGVFLLGGEPGVAAAAAARLQACFPALRVVGTHSPPLGLARQPQHISRACEAVCVVRPDLVFVALGKPFQEEIIAALRAALPHAWFVGVGISFSFIAGAVRRAPRWVQRLGLEWFHRCLQEPHRLVPRYLALLPLGVRVLSGALMTRVRRLGSPATPP
jgi:N-acetylglucosaminyldiphosphoundecaprenol N-acetyl-beta-D-mannosaminyltransferase